MDFPFFEAIMMVCFGFAWPVSILKSWRSRTNKGKSFLFLTIILTGYICGLIHKLHWQERVDAVVWVYGVNTAMVVTDMALYFRNRLLEQAAMGGAERSAE